MSRIGSFFFNFYDLICGKYPNLRPWHFQWLPQKYLKRALRYYLPQLTGNLLDIGCGRKPYENLLKKIDTYIGIDVSHNEKVDVVIDPSKPYPFDDNYFDCILCTQVLEHIQNLDHTIMEIDRVLKPGGFIIITVPFIYNEHGKDYHRFSTNGITALFNNYRVIKLDKQGGIGSTVGTLVLNWCDSFTNFNKFTRIIKVVLLPLWIPTCLFVNILGLLFDKIDPTRNFYGNVVFVGEKPQKEECEQRNGQ